MERQLAGRRWTQDEQLACVEAVRYVLRTTSNLMTLADVYKRVSEHLARHYSIQRSRRAVYAYVRSNLTFLLSEINSAMRQRSALPANGHHESLRYEQNPARSALLAPGFARDEDHLHMLTWSEWELDAFFWPLLSDIDAGWSPAPQV
ncbi:hypothetical protein BFW01_g1672 [Lasiodiplodia theobromae]|nr:hypothetical protein BFW01_g1672 [Lasiodiplodia theobromae]